MSTESPTPVAAQPTTPTATSGQAPVSPIIGDTTPKPIQTPAPAAAAPVATATPPRKAGKKSKHLFTRP
jgi:hypothetical protein